MQSAARQPVGVCLRDALAEAQVFGDAQVYADSCTTKLEHLRHGDVYFALDATDPAGASHAMVAAESGARAIVTDQYLPIFTTPQYVVPNAAQAHSRFCHRLLGNPSGELTLTAVAGAHGKTTTARLLTGILRHAQLRAGCLTDGLRSDHATSERGADLAVTTTRTARWLGDCVAQGCEHAVIEASQHVIRQQQLAGAAVGLLCLTSMRYDRSTGRTPAAEHECVRRLVERLAPFATLVASADDPYAMQLAAERNGLILTYGFDHRADVTGTVLSQAPAGNN